MAVLLLIKLEKTKIFDYSSCINSRMLWMASVDLCSSCTTSIHIIL